MEVPQISGGPLVLPATPATIAGLAEACAAADDALSVIATVMPAPPMPFIPAALQGQIVILAMVCYAGDPATAAQALAPLRSLATPVVDLIQEMPYAGMFQSETPFKGQVVAVRNMFVDQIDESAGATMLEHLSRSEALLRMVQFRVLGGAIARVAADDTAYAHRKSAIMVNVVHGTARNDESGRRWVEELAAALYQGDDAAYVNFFGPDDPNRIQAAYPARTLARLRRIKGKYDPTNLFRHNDNIHPR